MVKNRQVYILAAVLLLIGLGLFAYKVGVIGLPLKADEKTELWEVEAAVSFNARNRPVKLSFHLPKNSGRFVTIGESFVSRGYGISTRDDGLNRQAEMTVRKADGKQALYYKFTAYRESARKSELVDDHPAVRRIKVSEAERSAAEGIIRAAEQRSADNATFAVQVLQELSNPKPTQAAAALLGRKPSVQSKLTAATKILGLARIPARRVHGVVLGLDRTHAQFTQWLEIHDGDAWLPLLADATGPGLPGDHFPWWRGPANFAAVAGGDAPQVVLTVNRVRNLTLNMIQSLGEDAKNPVLTWSLFSLPLQTQFVFRLLLVVPFGVFLLVVLRNVVGVKTFGTFMPVLIALAFRDTGLVWGIVLFSVVVGGGLLARLYLEHLKLLLVPRLGAVLIIVIMLMAVLSIFSHKLDIVSGLSIALFPMVILTMTIERMSVVWDERGPAASLKEGLGSLVVAVLSFLVMSNTAVEHLVFVFPELIFVLLAATVLLGRYSGYRLNELARFRVLSGKAE